MSAKSISEADAKRLIAAFFLKQYGVALPPSAHVGPHADATKLAATHEWLLEGKLAVKPDQLIKRRGKLGLVEFGSFEDVTTWIRGKKGNTIEVEHMTGKLDTFIIDPFIPHTQADEYYICIQSKRDCDEILFHHEGGVDVGDVDAKATRISTGPVHSTKGGDISEAQLDAAVAQVPEARRAALKEFITRLYACYVSLHFTYLEINPVVMIPKEDGTFQCFPLDCAAKLDETARFVCYKDWGTIHFPPAFGCTLSEEEDYIKGLDAKTGASLKLTLLNPSGRVWTLIAGGGASVVFADAIVALGAGKEMANYGEYSGAPSEQMTFNYAKTLLQLMTQAPKHPKGKILIIGGGIANFTNVASTFKGIITALRQFYSKLQAHGVSIYVRRGGPNYQEGLKLMKDLGGQLDLPMQVFGPEVDMTSVVSLALGVEPMSFNPLHVPEIDLSLPEVADDAKQPSARASPVPVDAAAAQEAKTVADINGESVAVKPAPVEVADYHLFTPETYAFVYGMQRQAVQSMLDFDSLCGREPSVKAIIYAFNANCFHKFHWKNKEILIPSYQTLKAAANRFPEVSVVVNFASFRSVYETTTEIFDFPQIKTIALIAEGVPERQTRAINHLAAEKKVTIIGPATVGGIKPGSFRIGNTGGMLENVISSRLYRPGSVAYVARSGGLSNELNNVINRSTNGVYEGICIGGDRYPGSTFKQHLLRYQANPDVKIMLLLGEEGGVVEYEVIKLLQEGVLTKPLIAWCIGSAARIFPQDVQFGHAGALALSDLETANAKNDALKAAGAIVPSRFEELGATLNKVYASLVENATIVPVLKEAPVSFPMDYKWASQLGLIRKPASFVSSIVDERGSELVYAGMNITDVFEQKMGVGGVLGLIWFRRKLPDYFQRFIEMVLMLTADHGPAVSGAHNTIVAARAGKDLVSSLASGILTIGPKFGGAITPAAIKFAWAFDNNMTAEEYVTHMRNTKQLIPGIGHKVKSLDNPDSRVEVIKTFVRKHIKQPNLFKFACKVEQVTTKKKANLILNVDGAIGACFIDLMRSSDAFTEQEVRQYMQMDVLNGLFVLGRSLGLIGHYLDQKRLGQGLYREDTDNISYLVNDDLTF